MAPWSPPIVGIPPPYQLSTSCHKYNSQQKRRKKEEPSFMLPGQGEEPNYPLGSIVRKHMLTSAFLRYSSNHHPRFKTGIIRCLRNRADKICDLSKRDNEFIRLKRIFRANVYPHWAIRHALRQPVLIAEERTIH